MKDDTDRLEPGKSHTDHAQTIDLREHFGVPVLSVALPAFKQHREQLLELIKQQKQSSPGVQRSNQSGGWHSREDLLTEPCDAIGWLCSRIQSLASSGVASALKKKDNPPLRVVSLWANVNEAGDWNAPHHHLPTDWSGVFWVDAENDEDVEKGKIPPGCLLFVDPLPIPEGYGRSGVNCYLPKNGCLVIFPSYLVHMVTPHRSSRSRISMSFNLKYADQKRESE